MARRKRTNRKKYTVKHKPVRTKRRTKRKTRKNKGGGRFKRMRAHAKTLKKSAKDYYNAVQAKGWKEGAKTLKKDSINLFLRMHPFMNEDKLVVLMRNLKKATNEDDEESYNKAILLIVQMINDGTRYYENHPEHRSPSKFFRDITALKDNLMDVSKREETAKKFIGSS